MSHIVQIQTEVRDVAAIAAACRRLALGVSVFGTVKLFSESKTGWQVQLPEWRYPVVIDVATGRVDYDNYGGRWGNAKDLAEFVQRYAVEKAKIEARRAGHSVTEQPLADGSIKVTINVGGGRVSRIIEIIVTPDGKSRVETKGFTGSECREASRLVERALGQQLSEQLTSEFFATSKVQRQVREGQ